MDNRYDEASYRYGLTMEWNGKKVSDMSPEEVICFLAQVDWALPMAYEKGKKDATLKPGVV